MMKTYDAGDKVPYGVYFSANPFNLHYISDDEVLPGAQGTTFKRLPTLLIVAAGPAIGGIFVMAFPAIILMAVMVAVWKLGVKTVRSFASKNAHLVQMNWEPNAAYLTGDGKEPEEDAEAIDRDLEDDEVEALEAEVETRREEEEKS